MDIYPISGFSEPFSSLSHLLGAGVFLVLSVYLIRAARTIGSKFSVAVFCFSCVFLLSMSGTYHLLAPGGAGRAVLRRLDHAAIFVLIAGTFTPVHVILFRGWRRWLPLLFVWTAAITGITLKTIFFHSIPQWLGLGLYLALGWFGLCSAYLLWRQRGRKAIALPFWGGVSYTVGALCEFMHWPSPIPGVIGPHELFHIAVLMGIGLFSKFIYEAASDHKALPAIDETQIQFQDELNAAPA